MSVFTHVSNIVEKNKKYAVLVSGLERGFFKHLYTFLQKLPTHLFDVFLNLSNNDSKFMNTFLCESTSQVSLSKDLLELPSNFKQYNFTLPDLPSTYSIREKNTFYQYFRLQSLIDSITESSLFDSYTYIIRIRPDIVLSTTPESFIKILESLEFIDPANNLHNIYIPKGYDIFDHKILKKEYESKVVNDQFAICTPSVFRIYANTFETLFGSDVPIISECALYHTLISNKVQINRIDLSYQLVLSECTTIAIAGDSASGKSHLLKLLSEIFPYDKRILLETDRYHKYERYDPSWKTFTHLNPVANNLEKMASDMYSLKLGNDVYTVDYDHTTGKFTEPALIHSKPFVLLCGLHTLYSDKLRSLSDLKIFIDSPSELKKFWKIQRDVFERNHTLSHVLSTIEKRVDDFQTFVLPQKEHANIVLRFEPLVNLESLSHEVKLQDKDLSLTITIDSFLYEYIAYFVIPFTQSIEFTTKTIESISISKTILRFKHCTESNLNYYTTLLKNFFSKILYT